MVLSRLTKYVTISYVYGQYGWYISVAMTQEHKDSVKLEDVTGSYSRSHQTRQK